MGRIKSCASVFASRGDPWVSRREGERDFGRTLSIENPDMDQFTLARKAKPHFEMGNGMKSQGKKQADLQRKKVMRIHKMHKMLRGLK